MEDLSYPQRVGHRIRRKREIVGKTQREVAEALGMVPSQYSRLEKGEFYSIRMEQLARLADVLLTSTDYLLLRSDDMGIVPPDRSQAAVPTLLGDAPLPVAFPL